MTVSIYARVSTKEQNTENQIEVLKGVASKAGWEIARTFIDNGISGSKGRKERPALDALLKSVTQRETTRVLVWSVDRLGRSLQDLISTLLCSFSRKILISIYEINDQLFLFFG